MLSKSVVIYICPNCKNRIKYEAVLHFGDDSFSGAWKVHCFKCNTIHIHRIGRDIGKSNIVEGGKVVDVIPD